VQQTKGNIMTKIITANAPAKITEQVYRNFYLTNTSIDRDFNDLICHFGVEESADELEADWDAALQEARSLNDGYSIQLNVTDSN
jgi:hypothetical protein